MTRKNVFLLLLVFVLLYGNAHAVLTRQLSYQGRLSGSDGKPVVNGTYSIGFALYNVETGGSPLWIESQNVTIENGGFSVYLGKVTPLDLPFNEDYFLGIKVASDPEMIPRLKISAIGTSLFAITAATLRGSIPSDFAPANHTHPGGMLSETQLTQFNELVGGGVTVLHRHSFAGVTRIIAGSNISISPTEGLGDVTIHASGGGGGPIPAATVSPIDISPVPGTSLNYAREDHVHNIPVDLIANAHISPSADIAITKIKNLLPVLNSTVSQSPSVMQVIQASNDVIPLVIKKMPGQTASILVGVDDADNKHFEITNKGFLFLGDPAMIDARLSVLEVNATGNAANFIIGNADNGDPALIAATGGLGNAAWFDIKNVANSGPGVVITSLGSGPGFDSLMSGVGEAGLFQIINPSNSAVALAGTTDGSGTAVQAYTSGMGNAGNFTIDNVSNLNAAVISSTTGSGAAIEGYTTGTGSAGAFNISNVANSAAAVSVSTDGSGQALWAYSSGAGESVFAINDGTGFAGFFSVTNATSSGTVLAADTAGTGNLFALLKNSVPQIFVDNGGKINIANNTVGTDTIIGGTSSVTVSNNQVTATSIIILTIGHAGQPYVGSELLPIAITAVTMGVDFTVSTMDGSIPGSDIPFSYVIIN